MLSKARQNAEKNHITNTAFVFSKITNIDLPDSSADVVISNCVINLVPQAEKATVFKEIFRLLKPGGRVAVSDILAKKEFTEQLQKDVALYVGCVAGASKREEYEAWMKDAGFREVMLVDANVDLNVYTRTDEDGGAAGDICCGPDGIEEEKKQKNQAPASCCGSGGDKEIGGVLEGMKTNFMETDLNEWAGTYLAMSEKHICIKLKLHRFVQDLRFEADVTL